MSIRKLLILAMPLAIAIAITGCSGRIIEPPTRPVRTVVHTPQPPQPQREILPPSPQSQPQLEILPPQPQREALPQLQPQREVLPPPPPPPPPRPQPQTLPAISNDNNRVQPARELSSYETTFDTKEKNRGINIVKATESINGKIIKPGEEFSFNETIGPTIKRHGYAKATVYKNGKKAKGEGGGVCQVSTTLHMAAAKAGMTIVERHDHSLPVTYAKAGEEAATSYGVQDFKFKNDKNHSVQIKSHVKDGTVKVEIHTVT